MVTAAKKAVREKVTAKTFKDSKLGFWVGGFGVDGSGLDHNNKRTRKVMLSYDDHREVKVGAKHLMDEPHRSPYLCNSGMHACYDPVHCLSYRDTGRMFLVLVTEDIHAKASTGGKGNKFCGRYREYLVDLGEVGRVYATYGYRNTIKTLVKVKEKGEREPILMDEYAFRRYILNKIQRENSDLYKQLQKQDSFEKMILGLGKKPRVRKK